MNYAHRLLALGLSEPLPLPTAATHGRYTRPQRLNQNKGLIRNRDPGAFGNPHLAPYKHYAYSLHKS